MELIYQTPLWEEVDAMCAITKERVVEQNYIYDKAIQALKGCL